MRVRRFYDLMPHRIREVLLVSSPYDAFILEEDGLLTEETYREYRALSLHSFPRFTHVPTGEAAIRRLKERRFDLILVMTSLADMGVNALGIEVKKIRPGRPVVFLALDGKELVDVRDRIDRHYIDGSFLWSGDSSILLAIIQYVEDRENVDHDIVHGNVRVIIMVEDSPRFYSPFLGILYKELMTHSQSLYHEGANELRRRMYMKSRPKILLATSYEEGVELFKRYQRNVIAVISDIRIPRDGETTAAGLDFARLTRRAIPELPLLLQTAEAEMADEAEKMGAFFVNKKSPTLLEEIRLFLTETLGFGDFVFRCQAGGPEVARAHDVKELRKQIETIPDESIIYHANHNHFSIWLMARSEFETAEALRPTTVEDFGDVGGLREALAELLRDIHLTSHRGTVSDFSPASFGQELISRLGTGALGGKARGIAFLNRILADLPPAEFGGLAVKFPKTIVVTSEHFDTFVGRNNLRNFAYDAGDDKEIAARFVAHPLPHELRESLATVIDQMRGPLAVRSSSLLEDSLHQPFAGIYTTLMLPNLDEDPRTRLRELCAAVKLVYASTYFSNAQSYLANTGHRIEEEKMAVIIQELVGARHGDRFYPHFSGVAESYNFYPIGSQRPEEGVVHVALGLGRFVVDGGRALRFNPYHPGVLPPFRSQKALLDNTQRYFFGLDLTHPREDLTADLFSTVHRYDLKTAEEDGTLFPIGSVYSRDDRRIRDDLGLSGPRVVTFNNILKHRAIPLATALCRILEIARDGLAGPVEIEFACDMGDWGRRIRRRQERRLPALYILQMRPFAAMSKTNGLVEEMPPAESCLCVSKSSLGHGVIEGLHDIVYVHRDTWTAAKNKKIALEVARLNKKLVKDERPYLLIGPGRWGTSDQWLGIPVQWSQISNVKVIVEASPEGYDVEPSQGTHFFQNITSLRIGYLTLPSGADRRNGGEEFLDWSWLDAQEPVQKTAHLRHVRLERPLRVVLNGRSKIGVIAL